MIRSGFNPRPRGGGDIIGRSVTQIEYKGERLQSLNDVPFRLLRDALTDIMKRLTSTDPN
jgi:hypothetical protein